MARLSPRIKSDLQAFLLFPEGRKTSAQITDIGLGGARIILESIPDNMEGIDNLLLELSLGGMNVISNNCVINRKNNSAIGVSFVGIEKSSQRLLWQHIASLLKDDKKCGYCGAPLNRTVSTCPYCGWKTNFQASWYFDYWEKECLLRNITNGLRNIPIDDLYQMKKKLSGDNVSFESSPDSGPIEEFVGVSPAMKKVFSYIRKVAPTDLPVLILGESGTGKELTAKAIFERSTRQGNPFVIINCSAIPEPLIEAELFGYTKGAFTGAIQSKKGKFEEAHQGTLFLDEIGDLPLSLQPKLLRFLEDKTIHRIGAVRGKVVNVRIIAATNVELTAAVEQGRFRRDLYHRIASFTIHLPPLRERQACKEVLAKYFLKKIKMERDWKCKGFSARALDAICNYSWPGNVRELINCIRRAVVVQDNWIQPEDMELDHRDTTKMISPLKTVDENAKRKALLSALKAQGFNISRTARSLGVSRPYVYKMIKKMGIALPDRSLL